MTSTVACTKQLLEKLQSNIKWAIMRFNPRKSSPIGSYPMGAYPIVNGNLTDQRFHIIDDTPIPTHRIAHQELEAVVQCKPQGNRPEHPN